MNAWNNLSARDRRALYWLSLTLTVVALWWLCWQPSADALQQARAAFEQQSTLAEHAARAAPWRGGAPASGSPSASHLQDTALAARLQIEHFDVQDQAVRLTLTGSALALLQWLQHREQEGLNIASLTLEVEGGQLRLSLTSTL